MARTQPIKLILVHLAVYAVFAIFLGWDAWLPALCFATFLIWVSVVDIVSFEIPDVASILLILSGLVFGWHAGIGLWFIGVAALFWGGLFWFIATIARHLVGPDALGLGDAKLMAGIGAWLGITSPIYVVLAASLAGIGTMVIASILRREGIAGIQGKDVAFEPYLCLSAWVVWLSGAAY